ncbi:hypothetical protein LptCag_1696 [Leptospirillum ferriphilum]|uniref:Uncharacterized protein n=1 Tax=Leptospirillum ferriphilum TaxID=178606 RepID=A0A094WB20_9BACT|nr:hypothetical protein [Leptospirillum ferriphilum]KGA92862.1 hypothetical protein LptCag_1696 [Leptospirillum ferriphilum]
MSDSFFLVSLFPKTPANKDNKDDGLRNHARSGSATWMTIAF